jgi:hypothetical protein
MPLIAIFVSATSQHWQWFSPESFARSPRFLPFARQLEPHLNRISVSQIRFLIHSSSVRLSQAEPFSQSIKGLEL